MQADSITICVDDPAAPAGHTEHVFTTATYVREWNGIRVTRPDGSQAFYDNLDVVGFETYTAARAA